MTSGRRMSHGPSRLSSGCQRDRISGVGRGADLPDGGRHLDGRHLPGYIDQAPVPAHGSIDVAAVEETRGPDGRQTPPVDGIEDLRVATPAVWRGPNW